jgi:hypothetical protein
VELKINPMLLGFAEFKQQSKVTSQVYAPGILEHQRQWLAV